MCVSRVLISVACRVHVHAISAFYCMSCSYPSFPPPSSGVVSALSSSEEMATTHVGTTMFMSPERVISAQYGAPGDMWSVGITVYNLAMGKVPYDATGECEGGLLLRVAWWHVHHVCAPVVTVFCIYIHTRVFTLRMYPCYPCLCISLCVCLSLCLSLSLYTAVVNVSAVTS